MENPHGQFAAQWRPPTWRSLLTTLLLVLASVVAVVVLLSTMVNYFLVPREPRAAVDSYLTQLEHGSARQVLAPLSVVSNDPALQILPNPVYRHAANRPVDHQFVSVRQRGSRATVTVDVRTGDQQVHRLDYPVVQHDATGFFNDTWQLEQRDAVPVSVNLPAPVDALTVNGQFVPTDAAALRDRDGSPARSWQFMGLPGRYEVGLPENSYLLASRNASVGIDIADPRPMAMDLDVEPSPRMWEQVDRAVQDAVRECEAGRDVEGSSCPMPSRWASDASDASDAAGAATSSDVPDRVAAVRWRLESRPALVLQQDDTHPLHFHARRYRPAAATVSYVRNGKPVMERVEFGVDATARTTGNTLETEVRLRPALTDTERQHRGS